MAREYTPLPFEFLDEMDLLSDEEYGRLIRAMQAYSITGEDSPPPGQERFFWKRARNVVDRYADSYESRRQTLRENGRKGGRPQKPDGFSDNLEKPKKPVGFFENQTKAKKAKPKPKPKQKPKPKPKRIPPKSPPRWAGRLKPSGRFTREKSGN